MTGRRSTGDSRQAGSALPYIILFAAIVSLRCATSPRPIARADRFPLDPREELSGPFPDSVEKGWLALSSGDAPRAAAEFSAARSQGGGTAAEIGGIEAMVLAGRNEKALSACAEAARRGEPTLPLMVACAEARARVGDSPEAYDLYRLALARSGPRAGLAARAEELRLSAARTNGSRAAAAASQKRWDAARTEIGRAIALDPQTADLRAAAGDIEKSAGDRAAALRRYREALDRDPKNAAVLEKAGDLAVALGDSLLAVTIFEELARLDRRFAERAEEARMAFRVANWPVPEREAAVARRLTRGAAAQLAWWMVPEVREARVAGGVIASDAVGRRDSRAVTRAVALGLLEVDRHRARPDAPLTLAAASRLLLRLLAIIKRPSVSVPCADISARPSAAEAVRQAAACGLLSEDDGPVVGGPAFTRALDQLRALASGAAEGGA